MCHFELAKLAFLVNLDVSVPVGPFKSVFVRYLDQSRSILFCFVQIKFSLFLLWLYGSGKKTHFI